MRQEHKDEAVTLIRRLAEATLDQVNQADLYIQLIELIREVARTLPTPTTP